jgi:methionyl-tRNA synthetase
VKRGLSDLSISRATLKWGVPVPGDPKHVMYVWVDALTNYITATGFPDPQAPRARYWPADAHVIGKDITRFHAVYWPAFLMSAGLPLPKQVVVHGFLFNRGEKMSKSVGNVVSPASLVAAYGLDPVRYFFLREVPFGQDGNYSHEAIVNRLNADLANDIGNLAQRSLTMIARNCEGAVPDWSDIGVIDKETLDLLAAADSLIDTSRGHMEEFAIHQYVATVFETVARTNRYFATREPWKLAKSDPGEMRVVLYTTIEILRIVAILLQPVMPSAMSKLLDLLAVPPDQRSFRAVEVSPEGAQKDDQLWRLRTPQRLQPGRVLPPPAPVFPRYIEPEAAAQ